MTAALLPQPGFADIPRGPVVQLTVADAIGPATADYVIRGLESAAEQHASLVVLQLDTPGGLDTAMRDIIKAISSSPIPVVTYVAPTGARAASAGTYILYASHIAAMAPGTNLGAATPVSLGGGGPSSAPEESKDKSKAPKTPDNDTAMRHKVVNDAVAYLRGLAELHGRNADWAERAVRDGVSLPATDALKLKVIDLLAENMTDLLQQIDGRKVLVQGQPRVLHTTGLSVQLQEPDWRNRLLSVLSNPNVAYILLLIGIYGLIFEFSNPGTVAPGVIGGICLLLGLYSLQLLPINYAGIALILLGVGLMVAEAFQPSFGILGIGGVVAFVVGSIILIDTKAPGFGINPGIIVVFTLSSASLFIVVVGMALRARRRPVVSGREQMLGATATALQDFSQQGLVRVHGEIWQATTTTPIHKDQPLQVTAMQGLTLQVQPLESPTKEKSS